MICALRLPAFLRQLGGALIGCVAVSGVTAADWLAHPVQLDGTGFTIISDAPPAKVAAWARQFDERRRAAQALTGVRDDQLLPLTVLLFDSAADLRTLLPEDMRNYGALAVGLEQQPVIAMEIESRGDAQEYNLRFSVLAWTLSSTGVPYEHWILQGLYDLFEQAKITSSRITLGQKMAGYTERFDQVHDQGFHLQFAPGDPSTMPGMDWLAVHYLLIGETSWTGITSIQSYARRSTLGEPPVLAFKGAFGIDPGNVSTVLDRYAAKGRYHTATIPMPPAERHESAVHPANAGLRETGLARFLLQTERDDYAEAKELNDVAAGLRPDDVRVAENEVLYYIRRQDIRAAEAAMDRAIALGTGNPALQAAWCTLKVSNPVSQRHTFTLPADEAVRVADLAASLLRTNINRVFCYVVIAEVMPSIVPARPQDRALLESARLMYPAHTPTLDAGLAAWAWRSGDPDGARAALARILDRHDLDDGQASFARWLMVQVSTDQAVTAANRAFAARDYAAAAKALGQRVDGMNLSPALAEAERRVETIIVDAQLIDRAEQSAARGETDGARAFVRDMDASILPPDLAARRAAMLGPGKKTDAAGVSGGVGENGD